jgi:hypothetical protein
MSSSAASCSAIAAELGPQLVSDTHLTSRGSKVTVGGLNLVGDRRQRCRRGLGSSRMAEVNVGLVAFDVNGTETRGPHPAAFALLLL